MILEHFAYLKPVPLATAIVDDFGNFVRLDMPKPYSVACGVGEDVVVPVATMLAALKFADDVYHD